MKKLRSIFVHSHTYVITPDGKIAMEKKGMAKFDTSALKQFMEKLAAR